MDRPIKILLVEDSPADVRLTEEALKDTGFDYQLQITSDGEEALEFLHKNKDAATSFRPDIILLDLNMPKKNGHEVLAEIKEDQNLSRIPVVVLTVSQDDQDIIKALDLKMNSYINKPVTSQKLSAFLKILHLWEE